MDTKDTKKDKIISKFLELIKEFYIGPSKLVIMTSENIIVLNEDITLDDLNSFMMNNGGNVVYDSFAEFFTEFYAVRSSDIIHQAGFDIMKTTIPTISFLENDHSIIINS